VKPFAPLEFKKIVIIAIHLGGYLEKKMGMIYNTSRHIISGIRK
jgi:hypothetical protein